MRRILLAAACALLAAMLLAPASAHARRYTHEVLPGETLREIARRYHITVRRLRRLNRLRGDRLRAGRKLRIITPRAVRVRRKVPYRVRPGDSLSRIARRNKMSVTLLRRVNRLRSGALLKPGQRLWVVREGPDPRGAVKGLYRLESGPGFHVRKRHRAWGTFTTVLALQDALARYASRFPDDGPVRIFDLSRKGGGYLPPHRSHRTGRDVDIAYILKKPYAGYVRATPGRLDAERTWALIDALLRTGQVTYIFLDHRLQRVLYEVARRAGLSRERLLEVFQYPRSRRRRVGIIRHDPGHDTHFHVRFRSAPRRGRAIAGGVPEASRSRHASR